MFHLRCCGTVGMFWGMACVLGVSCSRIVDRRYLESNSCLWNVPGLSLTQSRSVRVCGDTRWKRVFFEVSRKSLDGGVWMRCGHMY